MELVILGGSGAWPKIGQACSGYLVSHDGYRLLIDPGYGVMGELLRYCDPGDLGAVLISHGHPDHCADLNPLLRARVLGRVDHDRLPVVAPRGALDAILALDPIGAVAAGAEPLYPASGDKINLGPFSVEAGELPHHVTTFGFRITSEDGAVLAYTADSGESSDRINLALHAGLLLAEVSYPEVVPAEDRSYLSDAAQIALLAIQADVDRCVLTHLMPFADPFRALALVRTAGFEAVELAWPGLARTIDAPPAAAGLPRRAARKLINLTDSLPRRASSVN